MAIIIPAGPTLHSQYGFATNVIMPSNPALYYQGRIEQKNPNAPVFYWPGSMVRFAFTGRKLSLCIENHRCYNASRLGCILDGVEHQILLSNANTPMEYEIPVDGNGSHTFTLFKRQDNPHYFTLRGITLEDSAQVLAVPQNTKLKLEFFGDSVTAGSVCEACEHVAQMDPPVYDSSFDNAWHSYAMQTARLLDAEVHLTAQGGIALLDGTGYFDDGKYGMVTVYDKLCYLSYAPEMTSWDFNRYQPDVVVVAIGQNDQHRNGKDITPLPKEAEEEWVTAYVAFLQKLRGHYPAAKILLTLTLLQHDVYWEHLMDTICAHVTDPDVMRFRFTRTGRATPGHPRIPEHCEMACELTEFIRSLFPQRY